MLLTVSNLYPRPDQPQRGLFNAQLFAAMAATGVRSVPQIINHQSSIINLCLVPEWRVWRWPRIPTWRDPYTEGLDTHYVPVWYLPVVGRNVNWRMYTRGLAGCMDRFTQSSGILATWLYPDGVAAAELARRAGKPIWLKVHGTDRFHLSHPVRRRPIAAACAYAQGIICNSHAVKRELIAAGLPESKLHVIPNGIDTTLFRHRSKAEARKTLRALNPASQMVLSEDGPANSLSNRPDPIVLSQSSIDLPPRPAGNGPANSLSNRPDPIVLSHSPLDLPPRPAEDGPANSPSNCPEEIVLSHSPLAPPPRPAGNLVLFVGNLVPIKGPDLLLSAFPLLQSEIRNSKFEILFLGAGPMLSALKRQAHRLGIADRVTFLGSRPHAEIALWMNVADCLCLPSRSEGMPNVVLEAMASGLPVVATDVGDCRRVLDGEPAARVVRVGDSGALAAGLEDVLALSPERAAMSARHRARLSWAQCAEQHLQRMGA